ncbi:MAG TPA: serine/threonine-protein kinase [Polyangiaceae bacterium]|nr:serine/threonine-protein kinase [Polyangiaceae bacterium]
MPIWTAEERVGQRVGDRYRLNGILSAGGMGVLFHGVDEQDGCDVAIKMLKPDYLLEPERVARFVRETKIAARLRHPNVARVLDVVVDDSGVPFLIMELLRGHSLQQELEMRHILPPAEALTVVLPIAEALASAHTGGIVHRDVKPANIFLSQEGTGEVVPKLLDFGIAKPLEDEFETQSGLVMGTPGYMAPEQAQRGECGPFTDVWATGAVLYRCLTGKTPHSGNTLAEIVVKLVQEPVPALCAPDVSRSLAATIDRALALDPQRRYPSMLAFVQALRSASGLDAETCTDVLPAYSAPAPASAVREKSSRPNSAAERLVPGWRRLPRAPSSSTLRALGMVAFGFVAALLVSAWLSPASPPESAAHVAPVNVARQIETHETSVAAAPSPVNVARPKPAALAPSAPASTDLSRIKGSASVGAVSSPRSSPRIRPSAMPAARSASVEREKTTGLPVATEW